MTFLNLDEQLNEIERLHRLQDALDAPGAAIVVAHDAYGNVSFKVCGAERRLANDRDLDACIAAIDKETLRSALRQDVSKRLWQARRDIRTALDDALEGGAS